MNSKNPEEQLYELTLKIRRFDPDTERSWIQTYRIEAGRILRFVDLFRKINDVQDPTLSWSSSCEHGQCGSCSVKVNGKPLLAWTIEQAKRSRYIDRLIVSSEDSEIIEIAMSWGCEVPFVRPDDLALDETPVIDVVLLVATIW